MFKIGNLICTIGGKGVVPMDPYNPLKLPPNTVRVRTNDGNAPAKDNDTTYETATLVAGTSDVYDVYKSGTSFSFLLKGGSNVIEVLGANTTGIVRMDDMFAYCRALTSVALFDTSSVINTHGMFTYCISLQSVPLFDISSVTNMIDTFFHCESLTSLPLFDTSSVQFMFGTFSDCTSLMSIPLFDTTSVTNMSQAFMNCINVESGALALYQQASTQTWHSSSHEYTFRDCGSNTVTGAAELAQIPSGWK